MTTKLLEINATGLLVVTLTMKVPCHGRHRHDKEPSLLWRLVHMFNFVAHHLKLETSLHECNKKPECDIKQYAEKLVIHEHER